MTELNRRAENVCSFKATGRCRLEFYESGKRRDESFDVKLWCSPPSGLYLQGDIAFNPRGIITGCNDEEFWFLIKPDLDSYWFGRRTADRAWKLIIDPHNLMNILTGRLIEDWREYSLSQENGFDVLNSAEEKVYIDRCDYYIRRIEYAGINDTIVTIELGGSIDVADDFSIPEVIEMKSVEANDVKSSVTCRLEIRTVRSLIISQKQKSVMFARPDPTGFKHVYEIIDGEATEQ